ncbi:MAG: DNA polymerase III subunit beta, partial [Bacteroidota bacterium]
TLANGVVGANTVLPILEDYLFSLKGDTLTITASNLETTIITSLQVSAEEEGQIAITAKILLDTLKALPEQPITLEVDEAVKAISITSAYGKYKLSGDSADDFPDLPESVDTRSLQMSSEVLSKALAKTLFATSNDELRMAMQGVYVQIEEASIIFVATDAHKLVKYTFKTSQNEQTDSFIIPKKGLTLLKNALSVGGEVTLSYNKNNAFFAVDDTQVIIRLIDAKYPDYNAVIPYENANILSLERNVFQSSLRRIAIYANKSTNQVVLNISEGSLTCSAQDLDFSNEANEQLTCEYNGEPMNIGFNAKFLIEMLGVLGSDDIMLKLSTPNRAGILVPAEQPEGEDLIMLVMPVMMGN